MSTEEKFTTETLRAACPGIPDSISYRVDERFSEGKIVLTLGHSWYRATTIDPELATAEAIARASQIDLRLMAEDLEEHARKIREAIGER